MALSATRPGTLFGRFRSNALSYGYAQIVTLVAQLVQVPFFLKHWGSTEYGDWLVLTAVPMLLVLLDLGFTQASANRATISAAANDWQATRRSLQTAFIFSFALALSVIAVAAIANRFLRWQEILKLTAISNDVARPIVLAMSVYLASELLAGAVGAWFRAIDRAPLGAFLAGNRRAVDILAAISTLSLGGEPVHVAIVMAACQVTVLCVLIVVVNKCSPVPMLRFFSASWAEFRSVLRPALAYASIPISQTITLQGGLLMLSQLANASVVVKYTMIRTLVRLIIQCGIVANNSLKPELSRLAGMGQMDAAREFTLRAAKKISFICFLGYLCVVIAGPSIIEVWSHGKVFAEATDILMIGLHAVFNVMWFVPAALLIATNNHTKVAIFYGAVSIFSMLLSVCLSSVIKPLAGAAMLLALPEAFMVLFFLLRRRIAAA